MPTNQTSTSEFRLKGVRHCDPRIFPNRRFTSEDGTAYVIDQRSGLQSLSDPNGNTLTIGAGGIMHSSGKSITFNRDSLGRITSITDPNGNSKTYTHDANGDLVSYKDNENNTSTYTYDANHRLLTIHDPRGIQMMPDITANALQPATRGRCCRALRCAPFDKLLIATRIHSEPKLVGHHRYFAR